jgi:hypothetical protein
MGKLLIIALLLSLVQLASGQSFYALRRERSLIVTGGSGTATYFGELSNDKDYIDAKPNITAGLQYYITNRINIRAEAIWFQLSGSDAKADPTGEFDRKVRNLSFNSNNLELDLTGSLNLYRMGNRYYRRPAFNIYGFGGVGLLYFNPTTEYQGKKVALQPLHTELVNYSRIAVVIPFGLGARIKLSPYANLAIEGGYRKTFTDYLDDVSTVHNDASKFSNPLAKLLSDRGPEVGWRLEPDGHRRGNPLTKDGYMLLSVKIEYYLPGNFQLGGSGIKKKPAYNQRRKSPMYRYNKRGGIKRR